MKTVLVLLLVAAFAVYAHSHHEDSCDESVEVEPVHHEHREHRRHRQHRSGHRDWHPIRTHLRRNLKNKACDRFFCQTGTDSKSCEVKGNALHKLPKNQKQLTKILAAKVGPKLAPTVAKLLASLQKVKLVGKVLEMVSKLAVKTLKNCGILEKLLAGGIAKAIRSKTLNKKAQSELYKYLKSVVPSCAACLLTKLVTLLVNGQLLGNLPLLKKLMPQLGKLVPQLLKSLKGLQKLLKPVRQILQGLLGGATDKPRAGKEDGGLLGGLL